MTHNDNRAPVLDAYWPDAAALRRQKTKPLFCQMMAERAKFERGSPDHNYLTRTARKYLWIMRGVPVTEWEKLEEQHERTDRA